MDREAPLVGVTLPTPVVEATPKNEPMDGGRAEPVHVDKEPGNSAGPCPPPNEAIRRLLANAMEMEKKTTDPGPHRAIAEAVRMRLDELYQHGCFRHLDDDDLLKAVAEIAEDPETFINLVGFQRFSETDIWSYYGTYLAGAVAHYRWHEGMIRTSELVTGERGDMQKQLMVLSGKIAKLPSYPDPVLVIANTHPWISSCWRDMRIRVLAPSGDPIHPKILLNKPLSGYWCTGITTEVKGDRISFDYDSWAGPWNSWNIQRPYSLTYQYMNGALVERFGFPKLIQNLPEDWIMRDWKLSQEATVESERDRLQPIHEQLHTAIGARDGNYDRSKNAEYSQEMFPVSDTERRIALYCAIRDTNNPCKHWPKPVDFFIEQRGEHWYVKDILARK